MKQIRNCDLCGGTDFKELFTNTDRMLGGPQVFQVLKCRSCSFVFTNPQPELHEIADYYPAGEYYSFADDDQTRTPLQKLSRFLYRLYFAHQGSHLAWFLFLPIRPLLRRVIFVPNGRFLDVGCGSGQFMKLVRDLGMEVQGVEPGPLDSVAAGKAGLTIHQGDLQSANFPDNHFDFISLNHVFEHVERPSEVLAEIRRILKPGGTAVIVVPNIDSFAYRLFRKYWVNLDTPRHLQLLSPKTLRRYGRKVGFPEPSITFISTPFQFLGSLVYVYQTLFRKDKHLKDIHWIDRMHTGQSLWLNLFVNLPLIPIAYFLNLIRQGDLVEAHYIKPRNE